MILLENKNFKKPVISINRERIEISASNSPGTRKSPMKLTKNDINNKIASKKKGNEINFLRLIHMNPKDSVKSAMNILKI